MGGNDLPKTLPQTNTAFWQTIPFVEPHRSSPVKMPKRCLAVVDGEIAAVRNLVKQKPSQDVTSRGYKSTFHG